MEEKVEKNIVNKVIIITGASRGIGNCIAKILSKKGYTVIANYNKSEKEAIQLKEELKKSGYFIDLFKADVSKRAEVKGLIDFAINKYKRIDCIINNAGIDQIKMFLDITDEDWNTIINNNLNSVFYMCQEALPYMIQKKQGCIINISSIWGQVGASCESSYAVSKAGVDALTKSLAKELGPSNIRVNSIAPGIIDTEMNNNISVEEKSKLIEDIPLQKIGKTVDIAKCVEWLIEDEYVTGQIIGINGGWLI
ncbi:MAG: elongation factor P 5-aminopentanone reductase [Clostridia bacterium]